MSRHAADHTASLKWAGKHATRPVLRKSIQAENEVSFFGKGKMPIDDERRRFRRTTTTPGTKSQATVSAKDGLDPKERVQASLHTLQEMLLDQRDERAGFREEAERRVEAHKLAAQRGRSERNEKYERLQQAFERMNRWRDEEKAGTAREESMRQGTRSLSYLRQGPM